MDIRTLARSGAAGTLVIAPAVLLAAGFVNPVGDTDGQSVADQVAKVVAHQGAMRAVLALDVLTLLVVPATLAVARLARRGAPRLALAGGWIAGAGWLAGVVGLLPLDAVLYEAARNPGPGTTALVNAIEGDALIGVLTLVFVLGHIVGGVLLGAALWRSRAVPRSAGLLVGITPLIHLASHIAGSPAVDDVASVTMLAGFAICAAAVVRLPDGDWDAAPAGPAGRPSAEPAAARP